MKYISSIELILWQSVVFYFAIRDYIQTHRNKK